MTTTNLSAQQVAAAYVAARTKKAREELRALVAERVAKSPKVRWTRLAAAMDAGDKGRLAYYASTGDERKAAGKALTDARKAEKAKATPAKATPAKAPAQPKADPLSVAAEALGVDVSKLAAFMALMNG